MKPKSIRVASLLASSAFLISQASAIVVFEDNFDNGFPTLNNYYGHFIPNNGIPISESAGSLRYGASTSAGGFPDANVNTAEVFQLPAAGQQISVEWETGPMTITVGGVETYGDIRQQLYLVSANFDKATFRKDAYSFGGSPGAFLGPEISYKAGTNPDASLLYKNNDSAINTSATYTADQTDQQIDPTSNNIFKLVFDNAGGVTTVTFFVNNTLSATVPLSTVAPNGEFDGGFFVASRVQSLNDGRGTMSLARITVDESNGVIRPPLPFASAFTFDNDLEGFTRWTFDELPLQDPSFTTEYGGAAKILVTPGENVRWRLATLEITSPLQLAELKTAAASGGTFSFDLIGEAGTLANMDFNRAIQPTGNFRFNDFYNKIPASAVRPLPNGKEIARVSYSIRDLVFNQLKPSVTLESNYKLLFGFGNPGDVDRNYYLDNILIKPFSTSNRAKLDFATNIVPFTAINGATIQASTIDPQSLAFTSPGTYGSYISGDFSSASSDPNVVAINAKLKAASHRGGYLQFTLKEPSVTNPVEGNFTYMEPLVTYGGKTMIVGALGTASFVSGATPTDYQRIFTVPLYPSSSTRTDGFVLATDENSYVIELGVNSAGIDSTTWNIDDFEVIVNQVPQVISAPAFPAGGGPIFGHVLSNDDGSVAYGATGLPAGVTIDPATGLVSGTPTTNGTYNVVFTASVDGLSDSTTSAQWVVNNATDPGNTVPSITSFNYNGGNPVVTWDITNTPMDIQRSTTLAVGEWTTISTGNSTGTFTDTNPPAGPKAFYRVVRP